MENENIEENGGNTAEMPADTAANTATTETGTAKDPAGHQIFEFIRNLGLSRSKDRIVGGVCKGIAQKLGWSVNAVRIIAVLLICFLGFGVMLYSILWLILPDERDDRIPLEDALFNNEFSTDFWCSLVMFFLGGGFSLLGTPLITLLWLVIIIVLVLFIANRAEIINYKTDENGEFKTTVLKMGSLEAKINRKVNKTMDKASEKLDKANAKLDSTAQKVNDKLAFASKVTDEKVQEVNEKIEKKKQEFNEHYSEDYWAQKNAKKEANRKMAEMWNANRVPKGVTSGLVGLGFILIGILAIISKFWEHGPNVTTAIIMLFGYTLLVGLVILTFGIIGKKLRVGLILLAILTTVASCQLGNILLDHSSRNINCEVSGKYSISCSVSDGTSDSQKIIKLGR